MKTRLFYTYKELNYRYGISEYQANELTEWILSHSRELYSQVIQALENYCNVGVIPINPPIMGSFVTLGLFDHDGNFDHAARKLLDNIIICGENIN